MQLHDRAIGFRSSSMNANTTLAANESSTNARRDNSASMLMLRGVVVIALPGGLTLLWLVALVRRGRAARRGSSTIAQPFARKTPNRGHAVTAVERPVHIGQRFTVPF
jgi:hypothetical protein